MAKQITLSTARKLAILAQGLDDTWQPSPGKEGAVQVIERIGYVQIDTIAVVQRAHHHTFWSRQHDYAPEMLHELQAHDRKVFEGWTHAASYIPMSDYRYYLPKMRAFASRSRTQEWMSENAGLVDKVLTRLREEGPLSAKEMSEPEEKRRGPWWDWKPAKRAAETLFAMGELMITERRNFQRIYDLAERVLPPDMNMKAPTSPEHAVFVVRRALASRGFASASEIQWSRQRPATIPEAISQLIESDEIKEIDVEDWSDPPQYCPTNLLEAALDAKPDRMHFLSPFDNLVIDRYRLAKLFGFDYKLECYHPAAKRRYGYFCLPILDGEQFVGRFDAKADRKPKMFILRHLILEPDFQDFDAMLPRFVQRLWEFVRFNGCEQITVEEVEPASAKDALLRHLDQTQ